MHHVPDHEVPHAQAVVAIPIDGLCLRAPALAVVAIPIDGLCLRVPTRHVDESTVPVPEGNQTSSVLILRKFRNQGAFIACAGNMNYKIGACVYWQIGFYGVILIIGIPGQRQVVERLPHSAAGDRL